jgi:hypothetical protein
MAHHRLQRLARLSATVLGLASVTLIGVGIRLVATKRQVRLAEQAGRERGADRPAAARERMIALREFIREAPVPGCPAIQMQGPPRPSPSSGGTKDNCEDTDRRG